MTVQIDIFKVIICLEDTAYRALFVFSMHVALTVPGCDGEVSLMFA